MNAAKKIKARVLVGCNYRLLIYLFISLTLKPKSCVSLVEIVYSAGSPWNWEKDYEGNANRTISNTCSRYFYSRDPALQFLSERTER